jgi:hypothetical protein
MVKIVNVFGDMKFGADGPAVYQNFYGKQIRRQRREHKKNDTPPQLEIQAGFKDGINFAETLSRDEIANVEAFIKEMGWNITWHNFARRVAMTPVNCQFGDVSVISNPFPDQFSDWDYRNSVGVSGPATDKMMLIEMQGTDPTADNYVDFSKLKDDLDDLRITDQDGLTPLNFFIISYDKTLIKAKVLISLI